MDPVVAVLKGAAEGLAVGWKAVAATAGRKPIEYTNGGNIQTQTVTDDELAETRAIQEMDKK